MPGPGDDTATDLTLAQCTFINMCAHTYLRISPRRPRWIPRTWQSSKLKARFWPATAKQRGVQPVCGLNAGGESVLVGAGEGGECADGLRKGRFDCRRSPRSRSREQVELLNLLHRGRDAEKLERGLVLQNLHRRRTTYPVTAARACLGKGACAEPALSLARPAREQPRSGPTGSYGTR